MRVARFNPDPDALSVVQELDIGPGNAFLDLAVGGGWVAIPESKVDDEHVTARLLRISTGEVVTLTAPFGHVFLDPAAYVTSDEVRLHVALEGSFVPRTLFKIPLPIE